MQCKHILSLTQQTHSHRSKYTGNGVCILSECRTRHSLQNCINCFSQCSGGNVTQICRSFDSDSPVNSVRTTEKSRRRLRRFHRRRHQLCTAASCTTVEGKMELENDWKCWTPPVALTLPSFPPDTTRLRPRLKWTGGAAAAVLHLLYTQTLLTY